jgi:hypothetical protein
MLPSEIFWEDDRIYGATLIADERYADGGGGECGGLMHMGIR